MITYKYNDRSVVIISKDIAEKYEIIKTDYRDRGLIDVADLEKAALS